MNPICRLFGSFRIDSSIKTIGVHNDRGRPFIHIDQGIVSTIAGLTNQDLLSWVFKLKRSRTLGWMLSLPDPADSIDLDSTSFLCFHEGSNMRQHLQASACVGTTLIEQGNYGLSNIVMIKPDSVLVYRHRRWVERYFFDGDKMTQRVIEEDVK